MPKKLKRREVPRHRRFVAFLFVVVVLTLFSFVSFAVGYASGRGDTLVVAGQTLQNVADRWQSLAARGFIAPGPLATNRLTGVVRQVFPQSFFFEADPVSSELFSAEPKLRTVSVSSATVFLDVAADGSLLRASRPLAAGDRVAVGSRENIRTLPEFSAERIERYR